jgi:hypothetical protein
LPARAVGRLVFRSSFSLFVGDSFFAVGGFSTAGWYQTEGSKSPVVCQVAVTKTLAGTKYDREHASWWSERVWQRKSGGTGRVEKRTVHMGT